jgi:hypothetical protein
VDTRWSHDTETVAIVSKDRQIAVAIEELTPSTDAGSLSAVWSVWLLQMSKRMASLHERPENPRGVVTAITKPNLAYEWRPPLSELSK